MRYHQNTLTGVVVIFLYVFLPTPCESQFFIFRGNWGYTFPVAKASRQFINTGGIQFGEGLEYHLKNKAGLGIHLAYASWTGRRNNYLHEVKWVPITVNYSMPFTGRSRMCFLFGFGIYYHLEYYRFKLNDKWYSASMRYLIRYGMNYGYRMAARLFNRIDVYSEIKFNIVCKSKRTPIDCFMEIVSGLAFSFNHK